MKHPSIEPDYRKGRKHDEFVTTLVNTGYSHSMTHLKDELARSLSKILTNHEASDKVLEDEIV